MRLENYLNEIGTTPVKVSMVKHNINEFKTKFMDKDGEVYFFYASGNYDGDYDYEIEFYRDDDNWNKGDGFSLKHSKSYISNIVSGVLNSLKWLLDDRRVDVFEFSAEGNELVKIYDSAIKLIERKFPDYKLIVRRKTGPYMIYKFKRKIQNEYNR